MITIENIKSILRGILILVLLLSFADFVCYSQSGAVQIDSTKISQKKIEADRNKDQNKTQIQAQNKNQGHTQKAANANAVKQVKSAKPDMSKAKGARPNVVRPSGSAIPKGAGKPGGFKRMGGR